MNQVKLWSDPKVRAARQAAAEAYLGRAMEFDDPEPSDDEPPPQSFHEPAEREVST